MIVTIFGQAKADYLELREKIKGISSIEDLLDLGTFDTSDLEDNVVTVAYKSIETEIMQISDHLELSETYFVIYKGEQLDFRESPFEDEVVFWEVKVKTLSMGGTKEYDLTYNERITELPIKDVIANALIELGFDQEGNMALLKGISVRSISQREYNKGYF